MSVEKNTRWPEPSVTSVPEYQLSGLPFTAQKAVAAQPVVLPRVSRWVVLKATGAPATIKFTTEGGVSGFTLAANEMTPRLELRCSKIFFEGDGSTLHVIAGLTHIDKSKTVPEEMLDFVKDP